MTDSELYKSLSALTKDKEVWEENIPYVESLLSADSVKIKSKALWMLGEMGLAFPSSIKNSVDAIASFLDSTEPILRERAINALGRIGRGCFNSVEPYWDDLFRFAHDEDASVRLAFIWASENIATNTPDPYKDHMPLFAELLHDSDDRVRMEAPEIFRVLGKRRPDFVKPYIERLRNIAETDSNRVVKIHCQGAIRAVE
jgi:HEAT repeat protein